MAFACISLYMLDLHYLCLAFALLLALPSLCIGLAFARILKSKSGLDFQIRTHALSEDQTVGPKRIVALHAICMNTYRTYLHTCMLHAICMNTYHTYLHTCMHACMHTCIHTCIHTYIRTYVRTYIHTYMHTYIHTRIYARRARAQHQARFVEA